MENLDWELHKPEIERLYLREGKTLKELSNLMESKHGFRKTKNQYSRIFKQWRFKKYRGGSGKWKVIKDCIARRNQESEVYIDGIICSPRKVNYEVRRHGFQTTMEQLTSDPRPRTPEGVVICSPGPSVWKIEWPSNLPWLRFCRTIWLLSLQGTFWSVQYTQDASSQSTASSNSPSKKDIVHIFGSLLAWKTTQRLRAIQSSSRTAAVLSVVMPEEIEGQHLALSNKLCGAKEDHLHEFVQVALFFLSNNLALGDEENDLLMSDLEYISKEDILIIEVLRLAGLDSTSNLRRLMNLDEPTAEAIAEKLFASALRTCNLRVIQMFLDAGMGLYGRIESRGDIISPLEFAARIQDRRMSVELTAILLSYDPDINQGEAGQFAFWKAADSEHGELMDILLFNGAQIPPWSLEMILKSLLYTDDITFMERVLDTGENIESKILWSETSMTMIGIAVVENKMALAQMLLSRGANVDALQPVLFNGCICKTTALGLAASTGNLPMIHLLITNHADVDGNSYLREMIPPLFWAVAEDQIAAVELLLHVGADIHAVDEFSIRLDSARKTLVERALDENNLQLCSLLLKAGAEASDQERLTYHSRLLFLCVKQHKIGSVSRLLRAGAQVNEIHDGFPDSALGVAIQQGDCDTILLLRGAGARLMGRGIHFIPNVETARCLKGLQMLPNILRDYGDVIVTSRIFERDKELSEFIFNNGGAWAHCAQRIYLGTQFEEAIKRGDCEVVQQMQRAGVKIRPETISSIGSLETAKYLDDAGLLPEVLVNNGDDILIVAILAQDEDLVEFLLGHEADQHAANYLENSSADREYQTPLEAALVRANIPLARNLITRGALVTQTEIITAVWEALKRGDDSIVSRFLEMFPPSFYIAASAVGLALQVKRFKLVNLLLHSGIDPRGELTLSRSLQHEVSYHLDGLGWWCPESQRGSSETTLDIAVRIGNRSALQALLASASWTKEARGRAFTLSMQCGRKDLAQDLWNADTDVDQELPEAYESASTPLQIAVQWGDIPLITQLAAAGANLNHLGEHSQHTALQQAVYEGARDIVETLISVGADINGPPKPRNGATALQLAVKQGNMELVELLLNKGADVNQNPAYQAGATALQFATIQGYIGIARKLLDAGAIVHAPKSPVYGRTAIEGAAQNGRIDVLQLLLNQGVSFEDNARTEYIRAVKLADKNGHHATARFLKSRFGWTHQDWVLSEHESFDYKETQILKLKTI